MRQIKSVALLISALAAEVVMVAAADAGDEEEMQFMKLLAEH